MSRLADILRARSAGVAPPAPVPKAVTFLSKAQAAIGRRQGWLTLPEVPDSEELRRIVDIPRRSPPVIVPSGWSDVFSRSEGCGDKKCRHGSLRPIQEQALYELSTCGGLLGPIGVGQGKTLIALLAGTVCASPVTVVLVPSQLREQLLHRDYPHLQQHWRLPNIPGVGLHYADAPGVLHVVAYTQLSSQKNADILDRLSPSLIVADEAHSISRTSSARTKRFRRYLRAHPETRFAALSGTILSRSIKDGAVLSELALHNGSPIPHTRHYDVLESWAQALDPSPMPAPPGALLRLCVPGEAVRDGFRRRLIETPGVVATADGQLGTSLTFYERPLQLPREVADALGKMRGSWITPGGEEIRDAMELSRFARQLASGFYYRWVWPRGESAAVQKEWLAARKAWHREVRAFLTHRARQGMDSPGLLTLAAASGKWKSEHWPRWNDVRKAAEPQTEAVWVSDFLVKDAVQWGREHRGVIWYEWGAVGEQIASEGGYELLAGGKLAAARLDAIAKNPENETIVVSRNARGQGTDGLQHVFNTQLFTTTSTSGKAWEQNLGRLHRDGQTADEVKAYVYRYTPELSEALETAIENAEFLEKLLGAQKLLYANYTFTREPDNK